MTQRLAIVSQRPLRSISPASLWGPAAKQQPTMNLYAKVYRATNKGKLVTDHGLHSFEISRRHIVGIHLGRNHPVDGGGMHIVILSD